MTGDDVLFDEVGAALAGRGGWHLEASTTPGGSPSWCLDPGGQVVLSVTVLDGAVVAYLPASDREVRFADLPGLLSWMDEREGTPTPG